MQHTPIKRVTEADQGHVQAHTGAQRFATVSGLNDMFSGYRVCNGVQQGLRYVFSCLVGVSKMSAQSEATCVNHTVLMCHIYVT